MMRQSLRSASRKRKSNLRKREEGGEEEEQEKEGEEKEKEEEKGKKVGKSVEKAQDLEKLVKRQAEEKALPPPNDDDPIWEVDEAYLDELASRVEAGVKKSAETAEEKEIG